MLKVTRPFYYDLFIVLGNFWRICSFEFLFFVTNRILQVFQTNLEKFYEDRSQEKGPLFSRFFGLSMRLLHFSYGNY